ncbi:MAG: aminotransferase [Microbacterium sp.]|nr:aminotransferase [Microbacterium sp.]
MVTHDEDAVVQAPPPAVTPQEAAAIARELFAVDGEARSLGSNQDLNFVLRGAGEPTLLKIANPDTTAAELEAQSRAARIVGDTTSIRVPLARELTDGGTVRPVEVAGQTMHARLLDFLEGRTLSGSGYLPPRSVRAMGRLAADFDIALADFADPGAERASQWDLRRTPSVMAELLPSIDDPALRARLETALSAAWRAVEGVADDLPLQVIHGDLTDDNVVAGDARTRIPDGVIDLGDLNRSWRVGELAITLSSLLHHDGVDLVAALEAARAYHDRARLTAAEADAVWPLVVARAVVLVASAHHVLRTDPGNDYAAENLVHEQAILEAATAVPLAVAGRLVRTALGFPARVLALPSGHGSLVRDAAAATTLDLSAASPLLDEGRWLAPDIEATLTAAALRDGGIVLTRFGEARLTRSRPHSLDAPANVATGVDVTVDAPTDLVAPWDGDLAATADGWELRAPGLQLRVTGSDPVRGDGPIRRGATIASLRGTARVAVSAADVDPPAFVTAALRDAWRAAIADPTPLLIGEERPSPDEDAAELLARRAATLAGVQEHYFDAPPVIARGWREHLVDTDGRVYLDTLNNVTSIGHAHPRLVEAIAAQWRLINTNSRFHYPAIVEFAERLAALLPDGLDRVFLVNSGSEAVDLALRLAQAHTGRPDIVALREAYHGWTYLADAVSTSVADNPHALATRPPWVHTVAAPNTYRGAHSDDPSAYARDAVTEVDRLAAEGTPPGAFIAESIAGNSGGIVFPDGYLSAVYAAVRSHGGVAVADEVQVGYGRLGEWFWGFEQQGVVPDIVAVAKAMGNGHPLGAVITSREIAESYRTSGYFFSSAGGSPVSSVAGMTVLDVIRDEHLQENARDVGAYLKGRIEQLAQRHPLIGTVHGFGLYLGPELVRDPATREPAGEEAAAISERLRLLGVIAQPTGDHGNVLKIKPPLCITRESADALVDALDRVLTTGW